MPNPSASSKTKLAAFNIFENGQIFLTISNMQVYKVKYHLWLRSKKFERVQKYWTQSKKFEHGQKFFELADGIGITLFQGSI